MKGIGLVQERGVRGAFKIAVDRGVSRWATQNRLRNEVQLIEELSHYHDVRQTSALAVDDRQVIVWVVPWFPAVYGGLRTIYRAVEALQRRTELRVVLLTYLDHGRPQPGVHKGRIRDAIRRYVELPVEDILFLGDDDLPVADAVVATAWESVYLIAGSTLTSVNRKYYFIQDFEAAFLPAGSIGALVEATYRMGFKAIVNTPGLRDFLSSKFALDSVAFVPGIDHDVFHSSGRSVRRNIVTVFFYGRPTIDRNGFALAVAVLKRIKQLRPNVRIVSAGEPWSPRRFGVSRGMENLGRLTVEETGNLYRGTDVGLVLMFSPHTSYIPLELMASGVALVTNVHPSKDWIMKDRQNCLLVPPTHDCLVSAVLRLVDDPELAERLGRRAVADTSSLSWDHSFDRLHEWLTSGWN